MLTSPLVLTPTAAAQRLGPSFTAAHVRALMRDGQLPTVQIGRRWYVTDLETWITAHTRPVESRPTRSQGPRAVDAAMAKLLPAERRFA